jgi:hypothetical protein
MSYIGELVPVHAPATGTLYWDPFRSKDEEVGPDEYLGFVEDKEGEEWDIRARLLRGAKGILETEYRSGFSVDIIQLIATIRVTKLII